MRASDLNKIAYWVWGVGWPRELARALGRHVVTVRRWKAGITLMSEADHYAVVRAMKAHMRERRYTFYQLMRNVKIREDSGCCDFYTSWNVKNGKNRAQGVDNQPENLPDF